MIVFVSTEGDTQRRSNSTNTQSVATAASCRVRQGHSQLEAHGLLAAAAFQSADRRLQGAKRETTRGT